MPHLSFNLKTTNKKDVMYVFYLHICWDTKCMWETCFTLSQFYENCFVIHVEKCDTGFN